MSRNKGDPYRRLRKEDEENWVTHISGPEKRVIHTADPDATILSGFEQITIGFEYPATSLTGSS